ncbi:MAG: parallel beta-helix domain-containing protein [Bythopirellula sp.]
MRRYSRREFLLLAFLLLIGAFAAGSDFTSKSSAAEEGPRADRQPTEPLVPGRDFQYRLQERLIQAVPGDEIVLGEGTFELTRQLDVVANNITIRGQGSQRTILSFKAQRSGGQGLEATGDNLVLEGFAIEDTAGNAVKVLGAKNVVFRDIRTEWTGPAEPSNGAYGIYPVQCRNVLIENCTAKGASDAGLYVGQCHNVIVRNSRAERNVAGIEIENTVGADVYDNVSTNNAGGILVFDLPGLQVAAGGQVRVFRNRVFDNNHANFAAPGNMVASVPPGTGVMIMATDDVEVFENELIGNNTTSVLVLSFMAMGRRQSDEKFDPTPNQISVHDNRIRGGGKKPGGMIAEILVPVMGEQLPEILYDGVPPPDAQQQPVLSLRNNGEVSFANFDLAHLNPDDIRAGRHKIQRDASVYQAQIAALDAIRLPLHDPPSPSGSETVEVYRSAPKQLSEYNLFEGNLANHEPAAGVFRYELNTTLFSDDTSKYRFVRLPSKQSIAYRPEGVVEFPVGTVISKTFSYPHDFRELSRGERHLETRIEIRRETGWYGYSYQWNEQQTDAELVIGGAEVAASWIDAQGENQSLAYQIPNANQCMNCHAQNRQFEPLGPTAENMNRTAPGSSHNQLQWLMDTGQLKGAPPATEVPKLPVAAASEQFSVAQRARAWLDVNCAHCHNPRGTARPSGLDLRFHQDDLARVGVWKTPVAAGHGSGGHKYDIVPGKPDESILVHRMESVDPSVMMPNVARQLVPEKGLELVRQWIVEMEQ